MARSAGSCSTGWCVGPSSPRPMLSCVKTKMDGAAMSAARRTGRAHVVGEHEEGGAEGTHAAVEGHAVEGRGHARARARRNRCCGPRIFDRGRTRRAFEDRVLVDDERSAEPPIRAAATGASDAFRTAPTACAWRGLRAGREDREYPLPASGNLPSEPDSTARRARGRLPARRRNVAAQSALGLCAARPPPRGSVPAARRARRRCGSQRPTEVLFGGAHLVRRPAARREPC